MEILGVSTHKIMSSPERDDFFVSSPIFFFLPNCWIVSKRKNSLLSDAGLLKASKSHWKVLKRQKTIKYALLKPNTLGSCGEVIVRVDTEE